MSRTAKQTYQRPPNDIGIPELFRHIADQIRQGRYPIDSHAIWRAMDITHGRAQRALAHFHGMKHTDYLCNVLKKRYLDRESMAAMLVEAANFTESLGTTAGGVR